MRKNILKDREIVDFEFQIARTEPTHLHQSVELLYVLEGEVAVTVGENLYQAKAEDIIVINANKKHSYRSEDDVLIAYFEIDFMQLCEMLNTNQLLFWCNSVVNQNAAFAELRDIMKQIFNQYYNKDEVGSLVLKSYYYQFLRILVEHFQIGSSYAQFLNQKSKQEERQEKIANYISANYKKRISLSELAEQFYVSVPYMSKYIKIQFGMNFSDYVNDIRMLHATDDLLYTERTIMNIALENGFASANTFNELFKKRYHCTPSDYRKSMLAKMLPQQTQESISSQEKMQRIDKYLEGNRGARPVRLEKASDLKRIDVSRLTVYRKNWVSMINAGRASDLLRSDMQEHILMLKKDLGFSSVRIWDFFGPELMINESDKEGHYNFGKADKVLDFLVEHDIIPYMELGYKPKNIHRTLNQQIIAEERKIPFREISETTKFLKAFIRHLVNRYGIEEIEQWSFEQWNGEDFVNEQENSYFFKVFHVLYEVVKAISPRSKVGGGGIGIQYGNGNLTNLVNEWKKQKYQPDFISLYCYPYVRGDENGVAYAKLSSDREFLKNQIQMARDVIKNSALKDVEIHVSEWSSTISNRNVLNDSTYKGAYIMKNILDSLGLTEVLGYWVGSDIFAEFYDNPSVLFGGCGLLTKEGIKKPAYYAYSFINQMHKYLVQKDGNYIITTDSHDNYFIACHNYQHLNYKYYLKAEDKQDINRLYELYDNNQILVLNFCLDHVKNGKYKIKIYSINDTYGSVQEEWKNLSFSKQLSKPEVDYLKRVCTPRIQIIECAVVNGTLEFGVKMSPQEIQYIHISYLYMDS